MNLGFTPLPTRVWFRLAAPPPLRSVVALDSCHRVWKDKIQLLLHQQQRDARIRRPIQIRASPELFVGGVRALEPEADQPEPHRRDDLEPVIKKKSSPRRGAMRQALLACITRLLVPEESFRGGERV